YVPPHNHENEQLTFVVSGRWRFNIDGKTLVVGPNEMLYIPPNMVHEAEAEEDLVAYDIFVPPREDWIKGEDAYLRNVKYESGVLKASMGLATKAQGVLTNAD